MRALCDDGLKGVIIYSQTFSHSYPHKKNDIYLILHRCTAFGHVVYLMVKIRIRKFNAESCVHVCEMAWILHDYGHNVSATAKKSTKNSSGKFL